MAPAPRKGWGRFLRGAAALLVSAGLLVVSAAGVGHAAGLPRYRFDVRVDHALHTLSGTLTITLDAADPRPRTEWLLHLPPNRFREKDPRGQRREVNPLPFGVFLADPDYSDPLFPNGPDFGGIEIQAVRAPDGTALDFDTESNPALAVGFFRGKAILRVRFPAGSPGREATISFTTRLPNRYRDGWDATGIYAESWHPVLLPYGPRGWERDPAVPAPGLFSGAARVNRSAWLILGSTPPRRGAAEVPFLLPEEGEMARTLPLVAVWSPRPPATEPGWPELRVFYKPGNSRVARLALNWGGLFLTFGEQFYRLPKPKGGLTFVQTQLPTGKVWSAGNTIFIPTAFFRNNPLLDRVFVAALARGIAEVWFGNTVLANNDTDSWLRLGLTGFLALDFFEFTFGWDAGIHDLVDWLRPRYREHFLENFALDQIRKERDPALTAPLYSYPRRREILATVFHKGPLVFRSLKFVLRTRPFRDGVNGFYQENRFRVVGARDLEKQMVIACRAHREINREVPEPGSPPPLEEPPPGSCAEELERFFDQWFFGRTRLDYELGGWNEIPTETGRRVFVTVRRLEAGIMPLDVQVKTTGGQTLTKRISGIPKTERVAFDIASPVASIALDPREFLLEVNRQNNHSSPALRLRPLFDWAKQRETLVTVVGTLGGNPVDGNYGGLGASIYFNEQNRLSIIPIYAERHSDLNFEGLYQRNRFLHPDLQFVGRMVKLGGSRRLSVGGLFSRTLSDTRDFSTSFALQLEEVEAAAAAGETIQESGNTNNLALDYTGRASWGTPFSTSFGLSLETSRAAFGSDFSYSRARVSLQHTFYSHANHALRLDLIRGWTFGEAPLQKRFPLGDPTLLRGYPRAFDLVFDHVVGLKTEYRFVVSRQIFGETIQTRKIEIILSYDIGKGWNEGETYEEAPTRKNAGIGFNINFNSLEMLTFPLRMEISAPIGDPEYGETQFIFFQVLSFF